MTSRGIWRCTRNRPDLLVVVDSEQFNGWQQLHDSYVNGYPDRNGMGFIEPKRIQVKLLKPDRPIPPVLPVTSIFIVILQDAV